MGRRGAADLGEQAGAEGETCPAAKDDAFGVEEVDQVRDPGAQVADGLLQYRGGGCGCC